MFHPRKKSELSKLVRGSGSSQKSACVCPVEISAEVSEDLVVSIMMADLEQSGR